MTSRTPLYAWVFSRPDGTVELLAHQLPTLHMAIPLVSFDRPLAESFRPLALEQGRAARAIVQFMEFDAGHIRETACFDQPSREFDRD